jgi:hypothetical protein
LAAVGECLKKEKPHSSTLLLLQIKNVFAGFVGFAGFAGFA